MCLQIEIFAKKNQKVEKNVVRFGVRVTIEFGFDFKIFSIANGQYKLLHINFGNLSHFDKLKIVTKLCKHEITEQIEW